MLNTNTHPCSTICVPRRMSQPGVSSSPWLQSTVNVFGLTNFPQPTGCGEIVKAMMRMTNRFVKISPGSKRLEIRRYEDADERVYLDRIQDYCVERTDQTTAWSRINPWRGIG